MLRLLLLCICATLVKNSFQGDLQFINNGPHQNLYEKKYSMFTDWIDCKERAAVLFYYEPVVDTGSEPRVDTFKLDPTVPKECQQANGDSYGSTYDRGHLAPANHFDTSKLAIMESNYMTNILPQHKNLNRGAWLQSEEIIDCLRDHNKLRVIGGVIMGNNAADDIFLATRGLRTPDWFWKIIINDSTKDVIAWIMPNDATALRSQIDLYLVSVADIEAKTGLVFNSIPDELKQVKQTKSWAIPAGCDKSK